MSLNSPLTACVTAPNVCHQKFTLQSPSITLQQALGTICYIKCIPAHESRMSQTQANFLRAVALAPILLFEVQEIHSCFHGGADLVLLLLSPLRSLYLRHAHKLHIEISS